MTLEEPSGPTTGRPEQTNAEEPKENDLKNNFLKMLETLQEEMKSSLKETEEKTNEK